MGWLTVLIVYVLGGITFLPLVAVAVLVHAYLTFPNVVDGDGATRRHNSSADDADYDPDSIVQPGDDLTALKAAKKLESSLLTDRSRSSEPADMAAGYFAVCREYTPMGINAKPIERATPVGPATVAAPSPSVYQTMYRSIFDRASRAAANTTNRGGVGGPFGGGSLSLDPASGGSADARPKKAGNVFYVVLRWVIFLFFPFRVRKAGLL